MPSRAVQSLSLTPKKRQCPFGDEETQKQLQHCKKKPKFLNGKNSSHANPIVRQPAEFQKKVCYDGECYLAIDCEMVGCGPRGSVSALARCSIVSHSGHTIYDKYVKPQQPITDYRTPYSGIRPQDMAFAIPFKKAQDEVQKILQNKIVIGHAVFNDFKALGFGHPREMTRDTSRYPALNLLGGFPARSPVSLKRLSRSLLGRTIQRGGHSSVEDARATMDLYKLVQKRWEEELTKKRHPQHDTATFLDTTSLSRKSTHKASHSNSTLQSTTNCPKLSSLLPKSRKDDLDSKSKKTVKTRSVQNFLSDEYWSGEFLNINQGL